MFRLLFYFADVECYSGYFGLDCRNHCRGYCMNNKPCDHVSGFCLMGCIDGYTGDHCNIGKGYFIKVNVFNSIVQRIGSLDLKTHVLILISFFSRLRSWVLR